MGSEKFCLRWNDFESNISSAFRELRDDKDFFDVTIACDDEQIQAHKLIIAACSPFFRNVLRRNPHQRRTSTHSWLLLMISERRDLHKTKQVQVPNIWVRSVEVVGAASSGSGGSKRKAENVMSL